MRHESDVAEAAVLLRRADQPQGRRTKCLRELKALIGNRTASAKSLIEARDEAGWTPLQNLTRGGKGENGPSSASTAARYLLKDFETKDLPALREKLKADWLNANGQRKDDRAHALLLERLRPVIRDLSLVKAKYDGVSLQWKTQAKLASTRMDHLLAESRLTMSPADYVKFVCGCELSSSSNYVRQTVKEAIDSGAAKEIKGSKHYATLHADLKKIVDDCVKKDAKAAQKAAKAAQKAK